MDKSELYPSLTSLVRIHRPRWNGRFDWLGLEPSNHEWFWGACESRRPPPTALLLAILVRKNKTQLNTCFSSDRTVQIDFNSMCLRVKRKNVQHFTEDSSYRLPFLSEIDPVLFRCVPPRNQNEVCTEKNTQWDLKQLFLIFEQIFENFFMFECDEMWAYFPNWFSTSVPRVWSDETLFRPDRPFDNFVVLKDLKGVRGLRKTLISSSSP